MNTLIEEVVSQTINKYVNENCTSRMHRGTGTLCILHYGAQGSEVHVINYVMRPSISPIQNTPSSCSRR